MKKNEAINYITAKGLTKRTAGKIINKALESVDISQVAIDEAIKNHMNTVSKESEEN